MIAFPAFLFNTLLFHTQLRNYFKVFEADSDSDYESDAQSETDVNRKEEIMEYIYDLTTEGRTDKCNLAVISCVQAQSPWTTSYHRFTTMVTPTAVPSSSTGL